MTVQNSIGSALSESARTPVLVDAKSDALFNLRIQGLVNGSMDAIISIDSDLRVVLFNPAAVRIFGIPADVAMGCPIAQFIPARFRREHANHVHTFGKHHRTGRSMGQSGVIVGLRSNGDEFPAEASISQDEIDGQKTYTVFLRDITVRIRDEEAKRALTDRLELATRAGGIGIWDWDIASDNLVWDDAMYALYGITANQFGGAYAAWRQGVHAEDHAQGDAEIQMALSGERSFDTEFRVVWPTGEIRHLRALALVQRNSGGKPVRMVGTNWDITALKAHQVELEHLAHFDALTGLPNRVLLADRLQHAMALARRSAQELAVAYLDLDGFKAINDAHGHKAGDQVLVTLARRMKLALREGDTLARIGGDEFVVVLLNLPNVEAGISMFNRLLAAAAEPVHLVAEGLQFNLSASIGVAIYTREDEVQADQLLRQADQAMYQAKLAGKNRFFVFDAALDTSVRTRHQEVEHMREALRRQEFVLHYQPKVNMRSGKVVGAEALIRWQHPQRGLLAPAAFLPIIEDHPLAVEVGEWVIDTALTQIEQWQTSGLDIAVSVNVGARQLQQPDFVERLRGILAKHPQARTNRLELEILETSALADMLQVSRTIAACATMGVRFALDDFGTGYSSLTYLKRLEVAVLKIDQSFVRDMLTDPDDLAILNGVIGLARAFKREVIAEGVETLAHGTALLELGCELAQGYGIARPMPAEQMPAWAKTWQPDAAWRALSNSPDA